MGAMAGPRLRILCSGIAEALAWFGGSAGAFEPMGAVGAPALERRSLSAAADGRSYRLPGGGL